MLAYSPWAKVTLSVALKRLRLGGGSLQHVLRGTERRKQRIRAKLKGDFEDFHEQLDAIISKTSMI
jgi:hypothetical protein